MRAFRCTREVAAVCRFSRRFSAVESDQSPLAARMKAKLLAIVREPQTVTDKALASCLDSNKVAVTSEIVYRAQYAAVECVTVLDTTTDIFLARTTVLRVAAIHAGALRDSNADLTNAREQSAADAGALLRSSQRMVLRTSATVHAEKFATVEYKLQTEEDRGRVVLWGAAVYRLWVPGAAFDSDWGSQPDGDDG
jgi:hypothetical protein